jgi:hypothetical protein
MQRGSSQDFIGDKKPGLAFLLGNLFVVTMLNQ